MATAVTKHIEGHFEIQASPPDSAWIEQLAERLNCEDVSVVNLALAIGLIDLMRDFGKPKVVVTAEGA